ncbi:MAG: DUF2971 domain-containing protein [Cyclobacteriaceae bacterium]
MNDQLEGIVRVSNTDFSPSKKAIKNFIQSSSLHEHYFNPLGEIKKRGFVDVYMNEWFRSEPNKYGVCCFSTKPGESLMWAHYALKHTGVCLVYDLESLATSLKRFNSSFNYININYGIRPIITLKEKKGIINFTSDIPIISAKDPNWKYEKELRFYEKRNDDGMFEGYAVTIEKQALKAIIYGSQISDDDQDAISLVLRNDPHYNNVKEYNCLIDYDKGKLFFEID